MAVGGKLLLGGGGEIVIFVFIIIIYYYSNINIYSIFSCKYIYCSRYAKGLFSPLAHMNSHI